jgi:drug/metabolite transporter (DMT)-like permease
MDAPSNKDRPTFAAGLLIGSMSIMAFIDNLVRLVSDDITVWQFHLIRGVIALPIVAFAARFLARETLRQRRPLWVGLRALVMAVSMLLFFASIPMMPMTQATAGLFTAPLFLLVFSTAFLGLRVGWRRIAAVVFGFCGVLVILQPWRAGIEWFAAMPVIAGAFYAIGVLITRQRCRHESPYALLFANFSAFAIMGLCGSVALSFLQPSASQVASAPFLFRPWTTPDWDVLAIMAGLALGAAIGVGGLTRAYQLAESSFLTFFDYTHLIGATIFAYLLWSEVPPAGAVFGALMIVGAGIFLSLRERTGAREAVIPS